MQTRVPQHVSPVIHESVEDRAHRIRRRMRDLREPEPKPSSEVARTSDERLEDRLRVWFVFGAWLLFFAVVVAAILVALHLRR